MSHPHPSYLVVTPARNEAAFARRTLDSVIAQSVPPTTWVIVDDGSTDDTPNVLNEYAAKHAFIRIVRLEDRGERRVGGGVIDAVNAGLAAIDVGEFDMMCKLDLDLELPRTYFEELIRRMRRDPRLGTCSGKAYYEDRRGRLVREAIGDDVSVGAAKFYRTDCFQQIGGFVSANMWDGIDCHRCRMRGWKARSWDDPELRFLHLRPMGSSQRSILHGRSRHGRGQYFMGTSLRFMLASSAFRIFKPPFLLGSVAMLAGYVGAMIRREPRYEDLEFRRFLRAYHLACLLHGKRKAQSIAEDAGAQHWQPADEN